MAVAPPGLPAVATVHPVTLRLTIDTAAWRQHVGSLAASIDGLVPVIKGNGYGFGRDVLQRKAAQLADAVAVGTVFEARELTAPVTEVIVLTPTLMVPDGLDARAVLTIGAVEHVDALARAGWRGRVHVKLESSMHRYGVDRVGLDALVRHAEVAGLDVHGYLFHPPLVTATYGDADAIDEIEAWLPHLDPRLPLSVSHLTPATFAALQARHPFLQFRLRLGTALWHGDKSFLHLNADVVDRRRIAADGHAGYRLARVTGAGALAMIGAGSAHGIAPLADGRSPFHFHRERLPLLEPPHMHTSVVVIDRDREPPEVGDRVDVQRPLISSWPDELEWR